MSVIRRAALSPALTGALLYVLSRGPNSLRGPLVRVLGSHENVERFTTVVKWLFGIGLGAQINRLLNDWALNHWRWSSSTDEWRDWNKEVAVITGGSSGIGALTTKGLAKKGIRVIVLDIQPLPEALQGYANISYIKCDITNQEEVNEVADQIRSASGPPSILLNNAGIALAHSILDSDASYLRRLFDVNLLSHWYLIQAFLPDMIKRKKGHIVSTASLASFVTVPHLVDYCATKAGALALHEGLNQELRHVYKCPEIKTSIVHPTFARTPLIESYREILQRNSTGTIDPKRVADAIVKQIASGKSGQIVIPHSFAAASSARGWPHWLQEMLRDSGGRGML